MATKEQEPHKQITLAGCIIQDKKARILLIHRTTPERTQWELPGGKVDKIENVNEYPTTTAIREVKEELDVEAAIKSEAGRDSFVENDTRMNYIWYNAVIISGHPRTVEDKHDKVKYFSWRQLTKMGAELSANVRNLLTARTNGKLALS